MKFLGTLGLVAPVAGGMEFALTPLGSAFIDQARHQNTRYRPAFTDPM